MGQLRCFNIDKGANVPSLLTWMNGLFIRCSAGGYQLLQLDEPLGDQTLVQSQPRGVPAVLRASGRKATDKEMADQLRLAFDGLDELEQPILPQRKTSAGPDISLESIGQDLCNARQRSGKTLMDISRELKILPHHVIAIEKGSFESLPGRVYAIGFVRSYATRLGLDAEKIVHNVRAGLAATDVRLPVISPSTPLERRDHPEAVPAGSINATEHGLVLLSPPGRSVPQRFIAVVIIAALIYSGYYVVASAGRSAPPPVFPVPARLAEQAGLTENKPAAVALVEPPALISHEPAPPIEAAPAQLAAQAGPTPKKPGAAAAPVEPPASISHELAPAPSNEVALAEPLSAVPEPATRLHASPPPGPRFGMQNRSSRVTLRVHRSMRVAVQGASNRILVNRIFAAGDTYHVPNLTGLKLSVPDAGSIEVILDGNTVGLAGEHGVAARGLLLDPPSIISRYRWQ
jgi:cytoskeleton protein RodZ